MTDLGTGGGISFNGPIELSGLALSKKYLLTSMDNYVKYMSNMLTLFSEDLTTYAKATQSSAGFEKTALDMQAWSEFTGGITSLGSAVAVGMMTMKGSSSDSSIREKSDGAKNEMDNHSKVLDGLCSTESEALQAPPPVAEGAGVGSAGAAPSTDVESNIRKLENGNSSVYKRFGESGTDTTSSSDGMSYDDVKEATKELVRRSRDPESTSSDREYAKKRLENIKERFREHRKIAQNEREHWDGKATNNSNKRQQYTQMIQAISQAASAGGKVATTMHQADARADATYASSSQQLNQQILSTTESTAQKAAQHAEDLIQLERQIQANNITRG
ncbi:MAG: hypothetical protein P0S95_02175 [Rhabdochlamydiaceae bacterium]|nr:hypothetical protein [Candidatus Amphrikana amoebophyrae]